jgi:hypothetical protein
MKALLALLMTASPAFASGIWMDANCVTGVVQKDNGVISYFKTPTSLGEVCVIVKTQGQTAELVCASGMKATLTVIDDKTIVWSGIKMTAHGNDCG